MDSCTPPNIIDKLVRFYSERREADIVLRVRYRRESAGDCVVFYLTGRDELVD